MNVRVRNEWLRRVEAEYHSAAITQHLTLWLIQIAAPPELISDGLAIVADEMHHARLSFEVYVAAGGTGGPTLVRESLQLQRTSAPLEHDVFRCNLHSFVLGETVAVRLFKRLRGHCSVDIARKALDVILVDEVRHREFGWTLMQWMLSTPLGQDYRSLLRHELPIGLRQVRENYAVSQDSVAPDRVEAEVTTEERGWGLMPKGDYREAVGQCIDVDYRPRFEKLGLWPPD